MRRDRYTQPNECNHIFSNLKENMQTAVYYFTVYMLRTSGESCELSLSIFLMFSILKHSGFKPK